MEPGYSRLNIGANDLWKPLLKSCRVWKARVHLAIGTSHTVMLVPRSPKYAGSLVICGSLRRLALSRLSPGFRSSLRHFNGRPLLAIECQTQENYLELL